MDTPIQPLAKTNYMVTRLQIVDPDGKPVEKSFTVKQGANIFRCLATYIDGSTAFYEPYWTCPMSLRTGGFDVWGVLGTARRSTVTIHASVQQERYSELACWVFAPGVDSATAGKDAPRDSIGFDYSEIDKLTMNF